MKNGFPELKTDTWAIIGAFSGWSAVMVTVMLALHSVTNARISEQGAQLGARIDAQGTRIDMLQDTMREEHNALRDEHTALRDEHTALRDEHTAMRHEHTALRHEHTLILESLGRVAQRVSCIEGHLGLAARRIPNLPARRSGPWKKSCGMGRKTGLPNTADRPAMRAAGIQLVSYPDSSDETRNDAR